MVFLFFQRRDLPNLPPKRPRLDAPATMTPAANTTKDGSANANQSLRGGGRGRGHIRGHALGLAQHPHVVRAASEGDVGRRHLHEASGHQGRSFTHLGQIIGYIMFPEK